MSPQPCLKVHSDSVKMGASAAEGGQSSKSALKHKYKGHDGSFGLLQTLETSLNGIRDLMTCRVCIRPLYEPYTMECGHTFCYGCLLRWSVELCCSICMNNQLISPGLRGIVRRKHAQTAVRSLLNRQHRLTLLVYSSFESYKLIKILGSRGDTDILQSSRINACWRNHR